MESKTLMRVDVIISLNEEEARWLKGVVQNSPAWPEDESEENKKMRTRFWNALRDVPR